MQVLYVPGLHFFMYPLNLKCQYMKKIHLKSEENSFLLFTEKRKMFILLKYAKMAENLCILPIGDLWDMPETESAAALLKR